MHRLLWSMGMKRISIFRIWRENCPLPLPTFHANCWLIEGICWKNVFRQYDFWPSELHEKILTLLGKICLHSLFSKMNWSYNRHNVSATELHEKILTLLGKICLHSLFSKMNWIYNRQNVSATISDQNFMSKSNLYCPDCLHLGVKMKVSSVASTWCTLFWHTIYRHQTTQILESAYH